MYDFTTATKWGFNQSLERIGYNVYFSMIESFEGFEGHAPWSSPQCKLTKAENVDHLAPLHIVYAETEPRDAIFSKTSLVLNFEPVKLSGQEQQQVKRLTNLMQDENFGDQVYIQEAMILDEMVKVKMKVSLESHIENGRWGVTKELGTEEFWLTPFNFADSLSEYIKELKV